MTASNGSASARQPRPRVPKGMRPVSLQDADSERLLSMTLALAAEVSVLTEELDTLRELVLRSGTVDRAALAAFEPDEPVAARRSARRRALIRRMLRIVLEDLDGPVGEARRRQYRELVQSLGD